MRRASSGARRRAAVVAGTALVAIVLGGATMAGASRGISPEVGARTPSCTTAGLVEWVDTQFNGAAGTFYYDLEFTNLSGHTCTLHGYPGVSGITLGGSQVGAAAQRDATGGQPVVALAEAKTAIAVLGVRDVGDFSSSACHPTTAAGFRVYAPNQTAPKTIPLPFRACSRAATSYLFIEAVRAS